MKKQKKIFLPNTEQQKRKKLWTAREENEKAIMANGLDLYTYLPSKFFFQKLSLKLNHYFLKTCLTT